MPAPRTASGPPKTPGSATCPSTTRPKPDLAGNLRAGGRSHRRDPTRRLHLLGPSLRAQTTSPASVHRRRPARPHRLRPRDARGDSTLIVGIRRETGSEGAITGAGSVSSRWMLVAGAATPAVLVAGVAGGADSTVSPAVIVASPPTPKTVASAEAIRHRRPPRPTDLVTRGLIAAEELFPRHRPTAGEPRRPRHRHQRPTVRPRHRSPPRWSPRRLCRHRRCPRHQRS